MVGSSENQKSSRQKQDNYQLYSVRTLDEGSGRLRTEWDSQRSTCDETDRSRIRPEATLFKKESPAPVSSDPKHWRRFYASSESPLKQWYHQRTSLEAASNTLERWQSIFPAIKNLLRAAVKLFQLDTNRYIEEELDIRVWKYGIYQFIVILRTTLSVKDKYNEAAKRACKDVFGAGIKHFQDLLISVSSVLKVDLEPILQRTGFLHGSACKDEPTKEENLIYRLFICLGDLYRYNFEINKLPTHLKMAVDMYTAAKFCDTEKPRAYNQLGVLNKAQNDIIGTIYNFTRACSSANAVEGARNQLICVYDEIYKMYNSLRKTFWTASLKLSEEQLKSGKLGRRDIWLPLTPKKAQFKTFVLPAPAFPISKLQHINSLSDKDVFSMFSLTFSHFLGKLYTKIGTETLQEVGLEATVYFEGIIMQKGGTKLSFLMEIISMVIFMTDYLTPNEKDLENPGKTSQLTYMRDEALRVSFQMVTVLIQKARLLMKHLDWEHPMLTICCAGIQIWCRWIKRRSFVWNEYAKYWRPTKSPVQSSKRAKMKLVEGNNFGSVLCDFHSELLLLFQRHVALVFPKLSESQTEACQIPVGVLPEQLILDGFGSTLSPEDMLSQYFYDCRHNLEKAYNHVRLLRILAVTRKIFGDRVPLTSFLKSSDASESEYNHLTGAEADLRTFILAQSKPPTRQFRCSGPDCNNARVILRKAVVKAEDTSETPQLTKAPITKAYELWSNLYAVSIKTELLIEPHRVVVDTNCFLHDLAWVECLTRILPNSILVPTTVVMELRGIQKGHKGIKLRGKEMSLDESKAKMIDSMIIAELSSKALEFLDTHRDKFSVVTAVGKKLKLFNISKQKIFDMSLDPSIHNDEKILETCRQLEARDVETRAKDTPLRIHRRTVLITGDRSLRVRAYAADIPARDMESFVRWQLAALDYLKKSPSLIYRQPYNQV